MGKRLYMRVRRGDKAHFMAVNKHMAERFNVRAIPELLFEETALYLVTWPGKTSLMWGSCMDGSRDYQEVFMTMENV